MRTNRRILMPLVVAVLAATTLAGAENRPGRAATAPSGQAPAATAPRDDRAAALQVRYYNGDPLSGGRLLATRTVQPQAGTSPFAGAPSGTTHVAVTTPRGTQVLTLAAAQAGRPDGAGARDGEDRRARPDADARQAPRGADGRDGRGAAPSRPGRPDSGRR